MQIPASTGITTPSANLLERTSDLVSDGFGDWRLARFRAAYHDLLVLRFAESTGDGALAREARASLARL